MWHYYVILIFNLAFTFFQLMPNEPLHKKMDGCRTNSEERTGKSIRDGGDAEGKPTRAKCKLHMCVHCARPFKESYALKLHIRRTHTGEKPFKCTTCEKEFSTRRSLKEHELDHVDTWPFLCTACGRQFKRGYQLTSHKRVHTGERPFPCIECGEAFNQATTLARHSLIHSGERPYVCGTCNQGFRQRASLKLHMQSHTCGSQSSGERFGQSKLDVHQTTNSEQTPNAPGSSTDLLQCPSCLKQYKSQMGLLYHMRTQHGVIGKRTSAGIPSSYTCDICSKTLQSASGLATHIRIHNGERPFACRVCGDRFNNKSHLRRHEKRNSRKRITCPVCSSGFISLWEVKRHLGSAHKLSGDAIEEAMLKCKRLVVNVDGAGCREKRTSQNLQTGSTQLALPEVGIIDGDLDYRKEAFSVASDTTSQDKEQPKISVEAILEQLMTNLSSSFINNNTGNNCDFLCDIQVNDEATGGDINLDLPESGSIEQYIENHMNSSGGSENITEPFDDIDVAEPDAAWLASMDSALGQCDYEGCGDLDALVAATDVGTPEAVGGAKVDDGHIVVSINGQLRLLDLASVDNWLNNVIFERDVMKGE